MFKHKTIIILIFSAIITTYFLAIPQRTIHIDEGMGIRASETVLEGNYQYSPHNGHGATLFYIGSAIRFFGGTNIIFFRAFTVLCTIVALLLLFFFYKKELSLSGQITLLMGLGFSSGFLFYSTYFIQEPLFILFTITTFLSFEKWLRSKEGIWLGNTVIFLALMYMTKETALLTYGAWFLAGLIIVLVYKKSVKEFFTKENFIFAGTGIMVSTILYFLIYGFNIDLLMAPYYWLTERTLIMHIKPWYYFLTLLFLHEPFLLIFGSSLAIFTTLKKQWSAKKLFLFFWFIIILAIYSILPYKTPWCIPNIILPIGLFIAFSISNSWKNQIEKNLIIFTATSLLILSIACLFYNNFIWPDRANKYDYAYVQCGTSFNKFLSIIESISKISSQYSLQLQIIGQTDELLHVVTEKYNKAYSYFTPNLPVYINYMHSVEETKKMLYQSEKEYVFLKFNYFVPGPEIDLFIRKDLYDKYSQSPDFITPSVWNNESNVFRYY